MHLRHLALAEFRSWAAVDLALEPGTSVLVGANGQGKTNLLEAVEYLATLGSHRVSTDAPLVRQGAETAVVRAAVVSDGRELRAELAITPGRANKARLNGAPLTRTRDLLGAVRVVLFAPEDLAIVRGDPGERRRFLDELVVARSPRMAGVRADYERTLKQRAALLKSAAAARRSAADLSTLDVWDEHLAEHGAELLAARLATVRDLRPLAVHSYAEVAPSSAPLEMTYVSALTEDLPTLTDETPPSLAQLHDALLAAATRMRPAELDRGVNLVGPHRDDLELALGDLPVRGYASHGEGWSAALALRLASFELLRTEHVQGGEPILLLDDVFAELDTDRREHLALVAAKAEQALVTAAVATDIPEQLAGAHFTVARGTVERVG